MTSFCCEQASTNSCNNRAAGLAIISTALTLRGF